MMCEFFFPPLDSQVNDLLMSLDLVPSFRSRDQSQDLTRTCWANTLLHSVTAATLSFLRFWRPSLLTHSDWP